MLEYLGQNYNDRDPNNITPFQGTMTFTYGKGVKERSSAKLVSQDGISTYVKNDEITYPEQTTKVYNTQAVDRPAIAFHNTVSSKIDRPVIQIIIIKKSKGTAVNEDVWVSI